MRVRACVYVGVRVCKRIAMYRERNSVQCQCWCTRVRARTSKSAVTSLSISSAAIGMQVLRAMETYTDDADLMEVCCRSLFHTVGERAQVILRPV